MMKTARLSTPIFGIIARTQKSKKQFTVELLSKWVRPWQLTPEPSHWWIEKEGGLAIFRPEAVIEDEGENAVLSIRGSVLATGTTSSQHKRKRPAGPLNGTLTILHDLLERDSSAIRDLRGQFALSFWDGHRRRLILARDHLGQRELFFYTTSEFIFFCSELSPLLRLPESRIEIDLESAFWYLTFGMSAPGKTLAKNVERLPAAHMFIWEEKVSAPLILRYWTPLKADAPRQADSETLDRLTSQLDISISRCLSPDAAQGILLSGGVDSTYLAATAKSMTSSELQAFTSAFDPQYGLNETEYAAAVARWLEVKHHVVFLDGKRALELMETVIFSMAEPCSAWASLTHFMLLAQIHQTGIKEVLSGLGADEIFGGYDHFRGYYSRFLRHYRQNTSNFSESEHFLNILLSEEKSSRRVLYPGVARFFDDVSLRNALHHPFSSWQYAPHLRSFYRECLNLKPEAQVMEMMVAHECQFRIPDLLFANFETLSRRMGINVCYPFLDPDLIELAAGLEAESRYRNRKGKFSLQLRDLQPRFKHAMMQIAASRIPPQICDRPRKSYTAPFGAWLFESSFNRPLLEKIGRSKFWKLGLVKRQWLEYILSKVVPGPNPWVFQLWALLTLIGWYDRFVEPPDDR